MLPYLLPTSHSPLSPDLLFYFPRQRTNRSSSAASAIAANTFLRSLAGAVFPLFSIYMYDAMGVNWAGTLLGCVAVLLVPIPVIFYKYGAKIRQKSKFAPTYPKPTENESLSNGDATV